MTSRDMHRWVAHLEGRPTDDEGFCQEVCTSDGDDGGVVTRTFASAPPPGIHAFITKSGASLAAVVDDPAAWRKAMGSGASPNAALRVACGAGSNGGAEHWRIVQITDALSRLGGGDRGTIVDIEAFDACMISLATGGRPSFALLHRYRTTQLGVFADYHSEGKPPIDDQLRAAAAECPSTAVKGVVAAWLDFCEWFHAGATGEMPPGDRTSHHQCLLSLCFAAAINSLFSSFLQTLICLLWLGWQTCGTPCHCCLVSSTTKVRIPVVCVRMCNE